MANDSPRNWEAIHQLLSIHQLLLGHPKLKPLLDEVESELESLQGSKDGNGQDTEAEVGSTEAPTVTSFPEPSSQVTPEADEPVRRL